MKKFCSFWEFFYHLLRIDEHLSLVWRLFYITKSVCYASRSTLGSIKENVMKEVFFMWITFMVTKQSCFNWLLMLSGIVGLVSYFTNKKIVIHFSIMKMGMAEWLKAGTGVQISGGSKIVLVPVHPEIIFSTSSI